MRCLLIHPNAESALNEEAGRLLLENYDAYARHARMMTDLHARRRPLEEANALACQKPSADVKAAEKKKTLRRL